MKKIISVSLFIAITTIANCQNTIGYSYKLLNNPKDFYEIYNDYMNYLEVTFPDSIPHSRMAEVKDFFRPFNYWKSRLGLVNGELSQIPYTTASQNLLTDPICNQPDLAQWELAGPTILPEQYMGLVSEVLSDPSTPGHYLCASENSGIWRKTASGTAWVNVTDDDLRLPGIAATEMFRDPFNNQHIIASTGNASYPNNYGVGIIESFDNGTTWSVMTGFPYQTAPYVDRVIPDPNDSYGLDGLTMYAIYNRTIFVTHNTGLTWSVFQGPENINQYSRYNDIEITNQGEIIVTLANPYANAGQIFKYTIDGVWEDLNAFGIFGNSGTFQAARISKPSNGMIFLLCDYGTSGGMNSSLRYIYKTVDYGGTWILVQSTLPGSPKNEIEYSPESDIVYVGDVEIYVFKSDAINNFTTIWENDVTQHADIRDFDFMGIDDDEYENVLVATDGGVTLLKVKTTDITDHLSSNLNGTNLPISQYVGFGISHSEPEFIVAGAMHCNTHSLYNNQWYRLWPQGDGGDCEVNWDNPNIFYAMANEALRWYNSFSSPHNITRPPNSIIQLGLKYKLDNDNPYLCYIGQAKSKNTPSNTYTAKLIKRDEKANTTTFISVPTEVNVIGAFSINSNTIFLSDFIANDCNVPNRFVKSTDGGASWIDLSSKPVYGSNPTMTIGQCICWKTIEDIVVNPDDNNEIWIGIDGVWTNNNIPEGGKYRVLHSTNGGNTWYDYSENLPAFPVNALEYQLGSNKRLFVGTDVGVYYRDNTMTQWECFSSGMPMAIVTKLDYNPCSNYLYASTYGRGIFKTLIPFNDNVVSEIPINTNIIWSNPKELASDLNIPSTSTLTIKSNVYISKNKKITIEPGGKLIIDGGKLTNHCGDMWQGIEVNGEEQASQLTPGAQGIVELKNGATIENALVAIKTVKTDANGNEIYGSFGGIIKANDAIFRNNKVAVEFLRYWNFNPANNKDLRNLSYFTNCTFETTSKLADNTVNPDAFVKLIGVHGIKFYGNTFQNTAPQTFAVTDRGIGIASIDASFTIAPLCTSTEPIFPCPVSELHSV